MDRVPRLGDDILIVSVATTNDQIVVIGGPCVWGGISDGIFGKDRALRTISDLYIGFRASR